METLYEVRAESGADMAFLSGNKEMEKWERGLDAQLPFEYTFPVVQKQLRLFCFFKEIACSKDYHPC